MSKQPNEPTIATWLASVIPQISSTAPILEAELLLAHHTGKNRAYLRSFDETALRDLLSTQALQQLNNDIIQLSKGYPLAYLLGKKDFWDMTLTVSHDVLIPRADTETLIEVVGHLLPNNFAGHLIDLGTGSGAIAIALSRIFPQSQITASDINKKALKIAKANAKQWQGAPITFVHADWFKSFEKNTLDHTIFDVIVSNPPYIAKDDKHLPALKNEPITALTADDNGLADIKTIIKQAQCHLSFGGWLVLEHGYDQANTIRTFLNQQPGWQSIRSYRDIAGHERITVAQQTENINSHL